MIGECTLSINNKEVGCLFGVNFFRIIEDEGLKLTGVAGDPMDGVYTVWAGIKNNCQLTGTDCDVTIKDVYLLMNNNFQEFEKAMRCLESSRVMGKPIIEVADDVKKKTKKKSLLIRLGNLFQRTA